MSVPDPGMWELCVFFVLGFACFLAWPFRLVVRCWLLLVVVVCLCPGCGLCLLYVVVLFIRWFLFLGEVLSVFRCSGCLWSVCSLYVSWFFGFPFSNKFLFIKKKKRNKFLFIEKKKKKTPDVELPY